MSGRAELERLKERRYRNTPETFWRRVDKSGGPDECWPWTGARAKHGYGVVNWQGRQVKAHRLALELAGDLAIGTLHACHHCDNPPCCNPAHLFVGTAADNTHDMMRKGRKVVVSGDAHPWRQHPELIPRGERTSGAKLTEAQVKEIRQSTDTQHTLARRYGVSQAAICQMRTGKSWGHLPEKTAEPPKRIRTNCPKGHDEWAPSGPGRRGRRCLACDREWKRAHYRRA